MDGWIARGGKACILQAFRTKVVKAALLAKLERSTSVTDASPISQTIHFSDKFFVLLKDTI